MSRSLERLMGIDREIRRGRYPSVEDLCDLFEVKPRTIYDDIRKLKENFGLEISYDRFHEGYVNTDHTKTLPSFDLTEGELSGLALSSDLLSSQASFLKSEVDSGIDKIKARVSESFASDFDGQIQSLPVPSPLVSKKTFDEIRKAIKNQNRIEMTYYAASRDSFSERVVEPYRILQQNGIWYVLAYCKMRKDLRIFAIHRIRDLKVNPKEKFERDKELDVEAWLSKAFQLERADREWQVTIHFLKGAAPYIKEKSWREGQILTENEDGSCNLSFSTLSLNEVKRWIMFYGSNAVVKSPPELVDIVKAELKLALQNYND